MKRVFLLISLVLLLLVLIGCQPISPTADLATAGTPTAADAVTATAIPGMSATPGATVTETQEITITQEMTDEEGVFPEAVFTAVEYQFQGPASISGGWTRIVLDNQGELAHDIVLAKLDEGRTLDDVLTLFQEESDPSPPEWVEFYGGTDAGPGEQSSYLINLPPGEYVYLSFGQSEEGPSDAEQGMVSTLTVTEPESDAAAVSLPEADLTVDLLDFTFAISGPVVSGEQLIQIRNSGEQPHHMLIFRLQEGATFEDFEQFMEGAMEEAAPENEPPVDFYGGMNDLSSGVEAYFTQEFEPGQYIFICFLPSEEHGGAPHFALGMLQQVEVE